jgi:magnesium chelatase family protein
LREYCILDSATSDLLKNAIDQFAMSARAHDRILKVARTIADLENSAAIQLQHIAEAVNYRTLDRKLFA